MVCTQTEEGRYHARRMVVGPSLWVMQAQSVQTPAEALNVGLVRVVGMARWDGWVRERGGWAGYDLDVDDSGSWSLCCVPRGWADSLGTVEGLLASVGQVGVI